MVSTKIVTAEDLLAMGSDAPFELYEGELHRMSPTFSDSSSVTAMLSMYISLHVVTNGLGLITSAEGGIILRRDPDTVVAPDIAFINIDRIPAGYDYQSFLPVPPDLAVEVVSVSDGPNDVFRKLALYSEAGVPLIWIVYPRQRAITVYRNGLPPYTLGESETIDGGDVLPGLSIRLEEIFAKPKRKTSPEN